MGCQSSIEVANSSLNKYSFSSHLLLSSNNPEISFTLDGKPSLTQLDFTIAHYQQFIENNPCFQHPFDGLGCVEDEVGCFEGNVELWYRTNRQEGKVMGNPYDALSLCYSINPALEEGLGWYKKMLERFPEVAQLWVGLGNIYYKKGAFKQAEQCYRQALDLNPRIQKGYQNIASIYCYHIHDNNRAAEWASFTLKINNDNQYAALIRELVKQDLKSRLSGLSKLHLKHPQYARIHNALGSTYIELKDYTSAINWFQMGKKCNPRYSSLDFGLAMAHQLNGNHTEAIKLSEQSLLINSSHHEPFMTLGDANRSLQNYEEAEKWYKKSMEANPDFEEARTSLVKLLGQSGRSQFTGQVLKGIPEVQSGSEGCEELQLDHKQITSSKDLKTGREINIFEGQVLQQINDD